jgi:hypothetical protein
MCKVPWLEAWWSACVKWGIQIQHQYIFVGLEPYILIDNLFLDPNGHKIGTRLLAHQVSKARQFGFQSIDLLAIRGREANGYYTWIFQRPEL